MVQPYLVSLFRREGAACCSCLQVGLRSWACRHYLEVSLPPGCGYAHRNYDKYDNWSAAIGVVGSQYEPHGERPAFQAEEVGAMLMLKDGSSSVGPNLMRQGGHTVWPGMGSVENCVQGDIIGLLLDFGKVASDSATLAVYLNHQRVGLMTRAGLKGALRWAVDLGDVASVSVSAKLAPDVSETRHAVESTYPDLTNEEWADYKRHGYYTFDGTEDYGPNGEPYGM